MFLLCLGAVRTGHDGFTLGVNNLLIALIVLLLVFTRKLNLSNRDLYPFLAVAILEIPIQRLLHSHFGIRSALNGVVTLALMILTLSMIVRRGNGKYLWSVVNFISILASVCLILQMACYTVGIRLDQIPFLSDTFFKAWQFGEKFRPCSLFSEPSHFAELALLSLCYYLLIKPNLGKAVILAAALILSTSNLGIIGTAMLFVLYVLNLNRYSNVSQTKKYTIILFAFLLGSGAMLWINTSSSWVASRLLDGGSSSVRILRSFELYDIMDLFEKLFGIGIQNQEIYLNYHSIILPSDSLQTVFQNREFAQTLGYILCTTGALGFFAFVFPFLKMIFKADYRLKCICLLFLFVCLTCCIFSRHIFLIYLILVFTTANQADESTGSLHLP